MAEEEVGIVESFFAQPVVAAIKVTGNLNVGDTIHIKGHTTDIIQTVESMQIEHDQISTAKAGDEIGIKVTDRVRPHDHVYRVIGE
jgi:putative protease